MSIYSYVNTNLDMNQNGNDGFQYYIVDCSTSSINISLGNNPYDALYYRIQRVDTNVLNTLTITATNSKLINGGTSTTMNINVYGDLIYINGAWMLSKYNYSL